MGENDSTSGTVLHKAADGPFEIYGRGTLWENRGGWSHKFEFIHFFLLRTLQLY